MITLPEGYKIETKCEDEKLKKDKLILRFNDDTVERTVYRDVERYESVIAEMVKAMDKLVNNNKIIEEINVCGLND